MENTDNYMLWNSNYVINITSVSLQSYSLISISNPNYSNIYIKSKDVNMFKNKTIFNILKDNTLRLDDKINYDLMTEDEISSILDIVSAFKIDRSSFKLNNLLISTAFDDDITYVETIRSIHNPLSSITMTNLHLNIQGDIFKDYDLGTNLYVDNVVCDLYKTLRIISIYPSCNFPEAILNNTIIIQNSQFIESQDRIVIPLAHIYSSSAANIT